MVVHFYMEEKNSTQSHILDVLFYKSSHKQMFVLQTEVDYFDS